MSTTPVRIQVDVKALSSADIAGVVEHPTQIWAQPIHCEFAGKMFKLPWAELEEYVP